MRLLVVNGPDLEPLEIGDPEWSGSKTLSELEARIEGWGQAMGTDVVIEQCNDEAAIVELIHEFDGEGIVLNPGAFTHASRAIADAIEAVPTPVVEVHIGNVARSIMTEVCVRTTFGRGLGGYRDAMRHLVNRLAMPFETVQYGPHPDNVVDLRGKGDDLVVLAHGGLWKQEFERDTTESLAIDLARRGYRTWNLEYRRLGDGGGWPGSGADVLTALDTLPVLPGGTRRIFLIGHSAGAYLLMWAAPRTRSEVAMHVGLAPLLDLRTAVDSGDVGAEQCSALIERGAPHQASPDGVPSVLVHGDGDQIVPVARSIAFAARHGLTHHHTGVDHFSLLDPSKPEWAWVVEQMDSMR